MHIYTHDLCAAHEVPSGHPERPERILSLLAHLDACGLTRDHPLRTAPTATAEDLLRAHPQRYLASLESFKPTSADEVIPVDPDTWIGVNSIAAATVAAGAVCKGVADLLSGVTKRVFCAVRPPGHHAERGTAMGFCLFNSIAVGALKALCDDTVQRVAIVDFDVHHGNGTVDIFKDNPDVLVCSSFQHPYYPNRLFDLDRPNIVNTPLPAGSGSEAFRTAIERDWLPALEAHRPDLVLVSAGFDAHRRDPLASLNLDEADFAWVTDLIVAAAEQYSQGRVLATLEGGYDLKALAASVESHLTRLA